MKKEILKMLEILKEKIEMGYSIRKISKELNMGYSSVKYWIDHYGLETKYKKESLIDSISDDSFINIVEESNSLTQVCNKIGYSGCNAFLNKKIKNKCEELKINVPNGRSGNGGSFKNKTPLREILVENSTYSRWLLKNRLIEEKLLEYKCYGENCGLTEWKGRYISLHLDHINGINDDNRLDNLRLLCPNCHSQTPTYSGKSTKKYNYCECGEVIQSNSKKCRKCSSLENGKKKRKVERPSYKQLLEEIGKLGYVGTGKKYGVSDNSIRKWERNYEQGVV